MAAARVVVGGETTVLLKSGQEHTAYPYGVIEAIENGYTFWRNSEEVPDMDVRIMESDESTRRSLSLGGDVVVIPLTEEEYLREVDHAKGRRK